MNYILSFESFSIKNLRYFYKKLYHEINNKIFLKNFENKSNLFKIKIIFLPLKIKKYTFNKAHHIDKKAREQFEIRVYKIFFIITPLIPFSKKSFLIIYFFLKNLIKTSLFSSIIKSKLIFNI